MPGLRHHLRVRPTGFDQGRDAFVTDVVKPEVVQAELAPHAVKNRFQRVCGQRKDPAVKGTRQLFQNLNCAGRQADFDINDLLGVA